MPSRRRKQSSGNRSKEKGGVDASAENTATNKEEPQRAGMPNEASIIGEKTLKSAKGRVYRILVTDQMDAYDKPKREKKKPRRKR